MNWIVPALLAPALYAIVNFVDKYIVSKEVKDYRGMPIYATIVGFIVGTIFWIATGFPILSVQDALIVLLTGVLTLWGAALYFKAISIEDASKLILWFQMTPVFTLILAFILLGERITLTQILGFFLILMAVISISVEKGKYLFYLSQNLILILIVDALWALSGVLIKFTIAANSLSKILSYESWGIGIGGLILYLFIPSIKKAFKKSLKSVRKVALIIMFGNESLFVVGKSVTFFAYSIGPAALVSIVGSTQVFFGILLGIILTIFIPSFIKEDISRQEVAKKTIAAIALFLGLWLVY
ncbi:TPA: hypothetical protein DIV55_00850 [Patescibacteria group bacterium]|uniref:EamA domain-containing protein n=1 Tax=Candidatus Gottesmanbacteria bacterium GW2011_GWA1_43_11 TaxID=1618436 RepID=A0A0G1EMP8_9BACT|nr:MAG: hypothetical protein UV59_C0022G0021 [Candidatus Gottesmanbacteria bacterium GW2011_GWA1_43_11]HCS78273.1 hypothetical protein [Patescibacteria group bacterium]